MSLLKLPFLLPQTAGMHRLMTPPAKSSDAERLKPANWGEWLLYVTWPPIVIKTVLWLCGLAEAAVLGAAQYPTSPISKHVISALIIDGSPTKIGITPLFVVGCLLIVVGVLVRVQAFRALGNLFTFELSIRKEHKLVTTGPYAFVRHPSYTGLFMAYAGELFCHASRGSWLRESGVLRTCLGAGIVSIWLLVAASIVVSLILRISTEEGLLSQEMGKEWDEYVERVRYKLVPGFY